MRGRVILAAMWVAACGSDRAPADEPARPELLQRAAAQAHVTATTQGTTPVPSGVPAVAPRAPGLALAANTRVPLQPSAAEPSADPVAATLALPGSVTTSRGGPSQGRLEGGIPLPERGPGYYHNPKRPEVARYGTVELVQMLIRAAKVVDDAMPGSVLVVNDLGLRAGGPIAQHGSHQAGRDADVLFYSLDQNGAPLPSVGVPIDPEGRGVDFKDLGIAADDQPVRIDLPRTWRFIQAMLEVAPDQIQRIFVVEHVRSMLLDEAKRAGAPEALRLRFEEVTCQPGSPHDDHLHVRLHCTPEDMAAGCLDSVPVYPWRSEALAALGLTPALQPPNTPEERRAKAARTTTPEQAKKRAGPMHLEVKRFLAQREAWIKQPHPGRPYCR